jgi:hypothetical protein
MTRGGRIKQYVVWGEFHLRVFPGIFLVIFTALRYSQEKKYPVGTIQQMSDSQQPQ